MTRAKRSNVAGLRIVRTHSPNVTAAEADSVVAMVKRCHKVIRAMARTDSRLQLPDSPIWVKVKNIARQRSYGGKESVSINLSQHWPDHYREYKSIADDPVIGTVWTDDPELMLLARVCHEFAHYLQRRHGKALSRSFPKRNFKRPHGCGWQLLYGWLRSALVNDHALAIGGGEA